MTREEEKQLLADLVFANQQLRDNLRELQKFDKLTQKVSELEKIDTEAIAEKINDANIDKFISDIAYRINLDLNKVYTKTNNAQIEVKEAAQKLKDGAKELNEAQSGLMQLENIAKSITKVEEFNRAHKVKTWYAGIIAALFLGVFSGSALTYAKSAMLDEAAPWIEFAAQNHAVVEREFETGKWHLQLPQNSRDVTAEYGKNSKDIITFATKQEVQR
ncbi:MAG: hypothetical protein A2513_02835 [Sulfurimonas sp. RIFOXYD12_FULL_33_39]|uniref:hypothetical protein n=1 Tax=unclassified Sulfurimonas TaxID=2623549 RepID=UPI0008D2DCA1|nr:MULTISPECIES: hypothetical protein [unclassified Sulfurimonas]OHE08937.1 MAG: hypothetical protein A2513_02835 [Sulfurimonas sp. RIFOXYD12_FULL_33_39]OHE14247.1 MAG: hypothetical protein A2530_06135 [Sulfurimonas sp. RIFOXYD2_FULL_34_21]DAB28010.1 MAG TPA: hypothetical protein CFH78_04915 [Sulfurimonas sp. UBA10385]